MPLSTKYFCLPAKNCEKDVGFNIIYRTCRHLILSFTLLLPIYCPKRDKSDERKWLFSFEMKDFFVFLQHCRKYYNYDRIGNIIATQNE